MQSTRRLISPSRRHDFYETDEKLTLSIYDKNVDAAQASLEFKPRSVRTPSLSHQGLIFSSMFR